MVGELQQGGAVMNNESCAPIKIGLAGGPNYHTAGSSQWDTPILLIFLKGKPSILRIAQFGDLGHANSNASTSVLSEQFGQLYDIPAELRNHADVGPERIKV